MPCTLNGAGSPVYKPHHRLPAHAWPPACAHVTSFMVRGTSAFSVGSLHLSKDAHNCRRAGVQACILVAGMVSWRGQCSVMKIRWLPDPLRVAFPCWAGVGVSKFWSASSMSVRSWAGRSRKHRNSLIDYIVSQGRYNRFSLHSSLCDVKRMWKKFSL